VAGVSARKPGTRFFGNVERAQEGVQVLARDPALAAL
jgi:hypothetical protein